MKRPSALRLVFAALAIAGLLLSPIAVPSIAATTHADMADQTSMAMPADMPCCPDEMPAPGCGKDCPFMPACALQLSYAMPREAEFVAPATLASLIVPKNDAGLSGLIQRPPPRPPKI